MSAAKTTKEKIGDEAIRLFVKRGIAETSMRQIAEAVGLTEGALYRHFSGKDEMVWQLFSQHYDLFAESMGTALQQKRIKDKVSAMVSACCDLFDNDRDVFFFLLLSQHIQRFAPKNYQPKLPALLKTMLKDAVQKGELPQQDIEISAAMVMGVVIQTASYLIYAGGKQPMKSHEKRLAGACWQILKTGE